MSTSVPPPPSPLQPQQDICYVKVGVLKNWELLFLSVTYSVLTGVRVRHLFLIPHYSQGTYEISTKKNLDPGNNHEKKFCTHENIHEKKFWPPKYPQEKILDLRNTHEKKILDPRRRNSTRPTEFMTLLKRDCNTGIFLINLQIFKDTYFGEHLQATDSCSFLAVITLQFH